jgi:CelD/BcsL family acetyltransferase involved in cellulose biosynthesis
MWTCLSGDPLRQMRLSTESRTVTDHALQVELIVSRSAIPLEAAEWNALAAANETTTVFQTWEWFDSWWRVFGHAYALFFLIVRDQGRVCGFAPLVAATRSVRELEFAAARNADYVDFVLPVRKAEALETICAFLARYQDRWDSISLRNVPADSTTLEHMRRSAESAGLHLVRENRIVCPTLLIDGREPEIRRLINKYSVRRPTAWFRGRGALTFRELGADEIELLLPRFFDQHVERWRETSSPSLFVEHAYREWYRLLARALLPRGWLSFSVVEFRGEPIAFHYGFHFRGRTIWYKPSFDLEYAARSPGLILVRCLIEDALSRGSTELDFTIGNEPFKARFTNHRRYNVNLRLFRRLPAYWSAMLQQLLRRAVLEVRDRVSSRLARMSRGSEGS